MIRNARRRVRALGDRATGRQRAIIEDLATLSERLDRVVAQTRQRVVEGVTTVRRDAPVVLMKTALIEIFA